MLGRFFDYFNEISSACAKLEANDPTLTHYTLPKPSSGKTYTNEEAKKLATAIANNKTIMSLTFAHSATTEDQFAFFAEAFRVNKTLQIIRFQDNPSTFTSQKKASALLNIFQENKSLSVYVFYGELETFRKRSEENSKRIHRAVEYGRLDEVKRLVEVEGISLLSIEGIEKGNYKSLTIPLHTAMLHGKYEVAEYLVEKMLEQGIPIEIGRDVRVDSYSQFNLKMKRIPIHQLTTDQKMLQIISNKKPQVVPKIELSFEPAYENYFSTRNGEAWLEQMENPKNQPKYIIFEDKQLTFFDSMKLAKVLTNNKHANALILRNNKLNSKAICEIVQGLDITRRYISSTDVVIEEIEIKDNPIGVEGAKALADAIAKNPRLKIIKIINCGIGAEGVKAIEQAVANQPGIQLCQIKGEATSSETIEATNALYQRFQKVIADESFTELHDCISAGISPFVKLEKSKEGHDFLYWILNQFTDKKYWKNVDNVLVLNLQYEKELQERYQLMIRLIGKIYKDNPNFYFFHLPQVTQTIIYNSPFVMSLFDAKHYQSNSDNLNNNNNVEMPNQLTLAIQLEKARQLFIQKQYQETIAICDEVIVADNKNSKAFRLKGDALSCQGRYQEAADYFMQILLLDNKDSQAWLSRANVLEQSGFLNEALECVEEVLKLKQDISTAVTLKVRLLIRQSQVNEAITFLTNMESQALETEKRSVVMLKARLFYYQQQLEQSLKYFQEAFQSNEINLAIRASYICLQQNKLTNAELTIKLRQDRSAWMLIEIQALISLKKGNTQEAEEFFEKVEQLLANDDNTLMQVYFDRALTYRAWSMYQKAEIYFKKVLDLDNYHWEAKFCLSQLPDFSVTKDVTAQKNNAAIISYGELEIAEPEIGQGTYGKVYKAKWKDRDVAVKKMITPELSAKDQEDFKKEIDINASFNFQYIVSFYGYVSTPACIVTEYMEKGPLDKFLRDWNNDINDELKLRLAEDIAKGLEYLHSKNIIHRDLKAANILLDEKLTAKITDFGLSVIKNNEATLSGVETTRGPAGTIPWMAIELVNVIRDPNKPKPKCTYASDIWSYGMVAWEIASRLEPFKGESIQQIIIYINTLQYPENIKDTFPEGLARLMKMCWNRKPEERPHAKDLLPFFEKTRKENQQNIPSPYPSNSNSISDVPENMYPSNSQSTSSFPFPSS